MRVRSLETDGVRGLPDRPLAFHRQGAGGENLVAVTGPPSSGKTTLLHTIIAAKEDVGPYAGAPNTLPLVRPGLQSAKVRIEWELAASERQRYELSDAVIESETRIGSSAAGPPHEPALEALLSSYEPDAAHGKVEYFHAGRRLPVGGAIDLSRAPGDALDRVARLGHDDAKYAGLVRFIVEAGLGLHADASGERAPAGRVRKAFGALCHTKRLAGLYQAADSVLPGFADAEGRAYGVAQLSDSERDALLFAATFVRAGLVDNAPGSLVLIDTPERHLGDAAAGDFIRALWELGPENQLVVATNSRAVVESAGVVIELGA